MAQVFLRTEPDGTQDTLTIVHTAGMYYSRALGRDSAYLVQVIAGWHPGVLCDLDGAVIHEPIAWQVVDDVPADVIAAVEEGWARGECLVERDEEEHSQE